jgi:hypothetical protein
VRQPSIVEPSTTVLPMLRPRLRLTYLFPLLNRLTPMKVIFHPGDSKSAFICAILTNCIAFTSAALQNYEVAAMR